MPPKPLTYNATLTERRNLAPQLAIFRIRPDEPLRRDPAFIPGQYLALGLNNDARPELGAVRRAMSIASAPEQQDAFEFYVRLVEQPTSDNPLTHLLWRLTDGDRIFMTRRPAGKFTLRDTLGENDPRLKVCVAAGTGLAPFVSMLRSLKLQQSEGDMSGFVLIHGASYPRDLCYADELRRYAHENGLRYFPTISRPKEAPEWQGDVGRAEDYFLPARLETLEQRAGLGPGELTSARAGVLVCGLQGTIARCIERLAARGFAPFHRKLRRSLGLGENAPPSLWWEQYDAEPVIDIEDPAALSALGRDLERGIAATVTHGSLS